MPFKSGKNGKVMVGSSDIAHVTAWTFNPTSENPSFASSSTGGYKDRDCGVKDGSGSVSGKYDNDDPIDDSLEVGTQITLLLYQDATRFFSVPSIVDGITYNQDIDGGEINSWDLDFSTRGAWTNPA